VGEKINQPYKKMEEGWLAYNPYRVNVGSIGIYTKDLKNEYISPAYVVFSCREKLLPEFLLFLFKTEHFNRIINQSTTGSVRQNLNFDILKTLEIPLPSPELQAEFLHQYFSINTKIQHYEKEAEKVKSEIENYLFNQLGISTITEQRSVIGFETTRYRDIIEWGINKITAGNVDKSNLFPTTSIQVNKELLIDAFRGKSPQYDDASNSFILNQKCVKWDKIEIEYTKGVDKSWLSRISKRFFTQTGDILVNSTGEGTIGRSCIVTKESEGYLYDSHVLCLRLNMNIINPCYWVYLFNSNYVQQQIDKLKSAQSTKQTELGISNIFKIQIPLPDLQVQNKIVEKISSIKNNYNKLVEKIEIMRTEALKDFEQKIFKP
jgi:restriction endonuclease S subunit